ncbi:MAG: transporter suffix domain-containing protein [Limnohabitans sp.]
MTLKLGIALILVSALPWLALPLAAWWAPSVAAKVAWSTGLLVAAEVLFWAGVALVDSFPKLGHLETRSR